MDRIHGGPDSGRGRKSWDAEQKSRNTSYKKNDFPQAILDLAQARGLITDEERKGRLSVVQKYLANPNLREAIGIASTDPDDIKITRPDDEFSEIFRLFIHDVATKKIDTRTGKEASDIRTYASELEARSGQSGERVDPYTIGPAVESSPPRRKKTKPTTPSQPNRVPHDAKLDAAIKAISSYKLNHLYFSLTDIDLKRHTPLLYVAAWSLIESLTKAHGSTTDFQSYLGRDRLHGLGFPKGDRQASIRQALQRVSEFGNSVKHDQTAAGFNGVQLANDIQVLTPVLTRLAEQLK